MRLDDPTLPPLQCMIGKWANGGVGIWNLREDFPLRINGSPVTTARLSPGDVLNIGRSRFVFSCEAIEAGFQFRGARFPRHALLPAGR